MKQSYNGTKSKTERDWTTTTTTKTGKLPKKKNQNKFAKNILFYHMNRAAPRAISLENHKKKNSNTRAVRVWPFMSASVSFNLLSLSFFLLPFLFFTVLVLTFCKF